MNIYVECGELRKVCRKLMKSLQEVIWISYGAKMSAEDEETVAEAKRLIARFDRFVGYHSGKQTDHRAAAKPNGAHTDDAGTN